MTMHLINGVQTIPKKSKSKLTKAKQEQIKKDWQVRCKELKSQSRHKEVMSLEEFTDYVWEMSRNQRRLRKFRWIT